MEIAATINYDKLFLINLFSRCIFSLFFFVVFLVVSYLSNLLFLSKPAICTTILRELRRNPFC